MRDKLISFLNDEGFTRKEYYSIKVHTTWERDLNSKEDRRKSKSEV